MDWTQTYELQTLNREDGWWEYIGDIECTREVYEKLNNLAETSGGNWQISTRPGVGG